MISKIKIDFKIRFDVLMLWWSMIYVFHVYIYVFEKHVYVSKNLVYVSKNFLCDFIECIDWE